MLTLEKERIRKKGEANWVWRGEVSNWFGLVWCDCEGSLCFIGVAHEGTYNDLGFVKVCAKFDDDIYLSPV